MKTRRLSRQVFVLSILALAAAASAQSTSPAVFVSNNGNLEGSVSAFTINPDGTLTFVNRVITGTRASVSDACPACNAYEISLSPDGAIVALAHVAGDFDSITMHRVNANGSLTQLGQFNLPTPFDVAWINNDLIAVLNTDASPDALVIYRYNRVANSLTQTDAINAGTGSSYIAIDPRGPYVYVNDSGAARQIMAFSVSPTGILASAGNSSTGAPFALELTITPNLNFLYSACGISSDGHRVLGYSVGPGAALAQLAGSPFFSPGVSPSNVYPSRDGKFLFVGHGTDATVRVLAIDSLTGALSDTGANFDVGLQGTLGDVSSAPNMMFVTDNSTATDGLTGIYSFGVGPTGTLTQNGPIVPTQGIAPRSIAVWTPPAPPSCPADANADGRTDAADLSVLLGNFGGPASGPGTGDFNNDGVCNSADLSVLLANFGCGAP